MDTLTEEALPGKKDDSQSSAGKEPSTEPVSRAEFQRAVLDLTSKLDTGLAANRQSATDVITSAVSKAQKTQNDFLVERLASLLPKDGPSLVALQREAYLDAQIAGASQAEGTKGAEKASTSLGSGVSLVQAEIEAILSETGLEGDEPELREYVSANKGKRWFEVGAGFYELALKIAARNKGSAAGIVASSGSRLPTSDLKSAYLADVAAMRKNRIFGLDKFSALKRSYRERGLEDVDTIDISQVK